MAVFTCPQCGHSQAVDDKHVGKSGACPKCKSQGVIREAPAVTAATLESSTEMRTRRSAGGTVGVYHRAYGGEITEPFVRGPLNLEWLVIDDPRLPVMFTDVFGVRAVGEVAPDRFWYQTYFELKGTRETIAAIEVRFLTFNVWGDHVHTLSTSSIKAMSANEEAQKFVSSWYLGSKAEGEEHFGSIGYVARVRPMEGVVLHADSAFVLREAQRLSEKCTEEDLEPKALQKER